MFKESLLELKQDFISFFLLHVAEIFCALQNDPWLHEALSALGCRLGTLILARVPTAEFYKLNWKGEK